MRPEKSSRELIKNGLWQILGSMARIMQNDAGIQREQQIAGCQNRVDIGFLDPRMAGDQLTELDKNIFHLFQVDRWTSLCAF